MGAADKRWRIVAYDVGDPSRWRKVHRIVRGRGRRIQYSVFRCRLDDRELERLRWELLRVLDPADRLLIINLCPSCASRISSRGHADDWDAEQPTFLILDGHVPVQATERVGLPAARSAGKRSRTRAKAAETPRRGA